jgi:hypothetical protein
MNCLRRLPWSDFRSGCIVAANSLASSTNRRHRVYSNGSHHPGIFMSRNVAVIDEAKS